MHKIFRKLRREKVRKERYIKERKIVSQQEDKKERGRGSREIKKFEK